MRRWIDNPFLLAMVAFVVTAASLSSPSARANHSSLLASVQRR